MVQRQSSWLIALIGPPSATPALLNTMCTPPQPDNVVGERTCIEV